VRANRSSLSSLSAILTAAALAATAGSAAAGPRRKRPARPALAAAVASGDPVAACRAAIAATDAGEHARASLVLPACEVAVTTAPELAEPARKARLAIDRVAERGDWSPVELLVRPAGAEATLAIDCFPGLPVREGRVMLPAGRYLITATNAYGQVGYDLAIADGSRVLVLVEVPTEPAPAVDGVLDFTDDEPAAAVVGPPPKIRHGSLLPERFRRGLVAR
jgi:hypothetical protein